MLRFDQPPENICIIRLSALGDVTHAVPVLRAIQKNWPRSRVTWICSSFEYKLLSLLDGVRFVVIDKNSGWRGYWRLKRQLAAERFDLLLQMQTSARANFTGACVAADVKLGWDKKRARDFHRFFMTHAIPETWHEHQLQGHLSFARSIGLDVEQPVWDFPITEEAAAFVARIIPAGQRGLLISPCSSHPARNWRADREHSEARAREWASWCSSMSYRNRPRPLGVRPPVRCRWPRALHARLGAPRAWPRATRARPRATRARPGAPRRWPGSRCSRPGSLCTWPGVTHRGSLRRGPTAHPW